MRQVEKMFLRKTEREGTRRRAPLLSAGCDLVGTQPRRRRCQWSGHWSCFIYIIDVVVQSGLLSLSLPSKFQSWVQACRTGGLGFMKRGLIGCCHPAVLKVGQWQPAEGVRVWLGLDTLWKDSYEVFLIALIWIIKFDAVQTALQLWWYVQFKLLFLS